MDVHTSVKPDFATMTAIELRAYVLEHRDIKKPYTSILTSSIMKIQGHGCIDLKTM